MATTEVDTAETIPLTPKIEVDDQELLTAEYDESANQLSKSELKKIETEITKALETVEQLGDEETETKQVPNDAGVRSLDDGAQENVEVSEGRVFKKIPSEPEVAEETTSAESHVYTVDEKKDEFHANKKLEDIEHPSTLGKEVDKIEEKERDVPYADCVDGKAEKPAGSQMDEQVPCPAEQTPSEKVDQTLNLESHKEGETQSRATESSNDRTKEVSSVPVEQIEKDAVVDDAKEEYNKVLDSEAKEITIPENQAVVHIESESLPNAFYAENLDVAKGSDELQATKEEKIQEGPSASNTDNNDSETKEMTTETDNPHEEGVEKVPERLTQPVEEHTVRNINKLEEEPEQARLLNDDPGPGIQNLVISSDTIPEKIEEVEPSDTADKISDTADKIFPDFEECIINEQQTEDKDTDFKEQTLTKVTVNDEPKSTSIDDKKTEQTNIIGQDGDLLTESHDKDVTAVSLNDENEDSNKKEINVHFITEVSKFEEGQEKSALQNDLPEFSSNSSAEKPELVVSDDSIRIAPIEELADNIKEQGIYTSESTREMDFALTTDENTGDAESGTVKSNTDVKDIQPIDEIPTDTKDGVSDDAGISILPEEEKDDIPATSKTVDSTPAENIQEKEMTSDLTEETTVELEKPHDVDSLQISKDEDAETKEEYKIKIYEKDVTNIASLTIIADDSSSELPLPVNSKQKGTSKEEEDEKHVHIDEGPEIVEPVPVVKPAEIEDAPGKDEEIFPSLSVQEPVEKVEHISQTENEEPNSDDIQGIAQELLVVSQRDTSVDITNVAEEVVTENAADKIEERSNVQDATKPDELLIPVTRIQAHGTVEISTYAEQLEKADSLDDIENEVQTSLDVVSGPEPDDTENQEKVTELGSDDSEKLKQVSERDPDDSENSAKVSQPDQEEPENLKQVLVPADSEKLTQVSEPDLVDSENLHKSSEPDPDHSEKLKQVSEPDLDESVHMKQTSVPEPNDSEVLELVSKSNPYHFENLTKTSEPDPDATETLKYSEPDPDDSENHDKVEKTDIPDDCDEVTIKAQPLSTNVEVLVKTDEEPREPTISDEVSKVSVAEDVGTRSFEVITDTDTAPEESIESIHEEDGSHQIPELRTEEKSTPSQITQEGSDIKHVEESGSEETLSIIEHNDDQEEKQTGAEGLSPSADAFVIDRTPHEADKEIKKEEIEHVAAETNRDESELPVTLFEGDQTLAKEVGEQHGDDEILIDDVSKEVILQENESLEEPEQLPKGAEEPESKPSASSLSEDREAPEEEKDNDELENADNNLEKISVSEKLVQPHDNPGDEIGNLGRTTDDTELAASMVRDKKITSLKSEEEKEETKDAVEPEVIIEEKNENDQPKNDNNVDDKRTADEVVEQENSQAPPNRVLNEPEDNEQYPSNLDDVHATILVGDKGPKEVQEKLLVEKSETPEYCDEVTVKEHPIKTSVDVLEKTDEQPRETTVSDELSSASMEEAVTPSIEVVPVTKTAPELSAEVSIHSEEDVSYQIQEQMSEEKNEPTQTTQKLITDGDTEHVEETVATTQANDAEEENQTSQATEKNIIKEVEGAAGLSPLADSFVENNKHHENDEFENVATDTKKAEPEIPVALIEGDQTLDQEVKEKHGKDGILKDAEGKQVILHENEPEEQEHLLEPSASSSNDDATTNIVNMDVTKDALKYEEEKDGLENTGNTTENISVSEVLEQPHNNTDEHLPSKCDETELATSIANSENITSLKNQEDEEIQEEAEPVVFIEESKENDQQITDDNVEVKQIADAKFMPADEQAQPEQSLNEPQCNEPSATGWTDEDNIERKKGHEIQEQSVESRPEDDNNVKERKVAEDAVVQKDEQREEVVNLPNETEHIEIPSDNFVALMAEEKENGKEEENENNADHETATEVINYEDLKREQLKHLQSEGEEAELSKDEEISVPKKIVEEAAKEIEYIGAEVVEKNKAVKHEESPSDSGEAEPSSVDERITVLKTGEEPEEILNDDKNIILINADIEEKENAEQESEQNQLMHVSDTNEYLEPSVSYPSGEKKTSLESKEIFKEDLEEKSENDHTEVVNVEEKETVNREFVLQEPSALPGDVDDRSTQKSEEPLEEVQEQKETTRAIDDGDTELSKSLNPDSVNKIVEAESSAEKTQADETFPRGEENTEIIEEEQKYQIIDEKVTASELSVEEDKQDDETEMFQKMTEDTSSAGGDKITMMDSAEKTDTEESKKDPSNEDSVSSFKELDAASIENTLESKEPESVEDSADEHSITEEDSSKLENKVETTNLDTEHTKSIDEEATPAVEAIPVTEDRSKAEDGKGLTETETHYGNASETLPSVEVSDSEIQKNSVETEKEAEEEKVESIIRIAEEEEKKDLINTVTHEEKLKGAQQNEVPILGEENQYAKEFVTTNTDGKNLQTLRTSEVPTSDVDYDQENVTVKEILNEVSPESLENQEAEALGEEDQKKLSISETYNDKMNEKITKESYVEADTTARTNSLDQEEISATVLAKGDEVQIEHNWEGNLPRTMDTSSFGLDDATRATSETPIAEKVPDKSAIESESIVEQITKDEIIVNENSVDEGKNLEPLSLRSPMPEELNVTEDAEIKDPLHMQEMSYVPTQSKDELNRLEGQAKYINIMHDVGQEEEKISKQCDASPIVTERVQLQEPEPIIALAGDLRTEEVTSTKLNKEETKGEIETQIETPSNISEVVGANKVQFQENLTVSPGDDKSEIEIPKETTVSTESPHVSTREVCAGEGKQITEAQAEELLENKMEAIIKTEAVKLEGEIKDEDIQDLNTQETKGDVLEKLNLDESNANDAAIKLNPTDRDTTQVTETPSELVQLSSILLEKPDTNILEKRESKETIEESRTVERSTESLTEGTTSKDPIAIAKGETKPSPETEIQSSTRELVNPQSKISTAHTKVNETILGIQQLNESTRETPLGENTYADKTPKGDPTPVATEKKDVPTEIHQSTARNLDFTEAVKPESAKKPESNIPSTIPAESLLSDLLQISPKDTIQMTQQSNQETITTPKKEDLQPEDPKTEEGKNDEEEEEGEEHKKTDSSSDEVIVEASRDMDVKSPQKKHHGILSGVGSKVKNSISKVKKAITGKSSHPKPPSPK